MNTYSKPAFRMLAVMLLMSMLVSLLPVHVLRAEIRFSDVDNRYSWAVRSINLMADKQVLTGYPDGRFHPAQAISKAEWTAMVYRLFNKYRPNLYAEGLRKISYFTDVPTLHWANKPISEMYDAGFSIGGYGVNRNGELAFRPDMQLTRLQLAQMLNAFFDNRLIDRRISDNDACAIVSGMKDVPLKLYRSQADYDNAKNDGRYAAGELMSVETSDVYLTLALGNDTGDCSLGDDALSNVQVKALASLKANGIMTPDSGGYFRPKDAVTRAEAVTILDRIYTYLKKSYWLSDYTSVDLNVPASPDSTGTGSSGGTSDPYSPVPGSDNPVIVPNDSNGDGKLGTNPDWSDKSIIRSTDYFDEKGVIEKDIRNKGELEAAIQPRGKKYLTVDFKSKEKVDLYLILDGKIAFVKQEEFPLTLPVGDLSVVGFRSQQRGPKSNVAGELKVTLSAQLLDEEPPKKKK